MIVLYVIILLLSENYFEVGEGIYMKDNIYVIGL